MTDTVLFILGIAAILGINFFVLHRINRKSYLHRKRALPKLRYGRGEPVMPAPQNEPELTLSENKSKDYVEWYTSRSPAGQKQRQHLFESAPPGETPLEGDSFVGMAIVHDEEEDSEKGEEKRSRSTKSKGNVERWFKQAGDQ